MKIFFVTALFLAVAASGVYSQACHMREVDLCMAIGMFAFQNTRIPENEEKLDEWCETSKEVQECMGNYSTKCVSPVQREVLGLLQDNDNKIIKDLCVPGSEIRTRFLAHAECMSEGAESDEFNGHLRDLQVIVEKLFDVEFKQRFPLLCCGFRRFDYEIDTMTERRCGKETVELVRGVVKSITTDLPEILCQRYDLNSNECNVLPPKGTPPKGGENKSQLSKLLDTLFGNN